MNQSTENGMAIKIENYQSENGDKKLTEYTQRVNLRKSPDDVILTFFKAQNTRAYASTRGKGKQCGIQYTRFRRVSQ